MCKGERGWTRGGMSVSESPLTCRSDTTQVLLRIVELILAAFTMSYVVDASNPLEMTSIQSIGRCVMTISPRVHSTW